jgi:hypothetical protein
MNPHTPHECGKGRGHLQAIMLVAGWRCRQIWRIGPAGDVWVMDNWQIRDSCFKNTSYDEALSTRCVGDGVTIFFGMAKPVRAPQIGSARAVLSVASWMRAETRVNHRVQARR